LYAKISNGETEKRRRTGVRYLHKELGSKMLVNAGNRKAVDAVNVDNAERWSYTANEESRQP
jgi:hypothetical protein